MNSEKDLFNKLKPAIRCKKHELINDKISNVSEYDIWNYNKIFNWKKAKGLTISMMVDNILNTPNDNYYKFALNKIKDSEKNE